MLIVDTCCCFIDLRIGAIIICVLNAIYGGGLLTDGLNERHYC